MIREAICSLLKNCSKTKAFRQGISLHSVVLNIGLQADVIISNHVLNMYAKCGNPCSARQVFDDMSERNLVSWSAMISGYDQCGEHLMALELYSQMQKMQIMPNEFIFSSVVSACASLMALSEGQQIHAHSVKYGCASISFVANSLLSMYMKSGQCNDALSAYASSSELNSVSYNSMITGFLENNHPERGLEFFKLMHQKGLRPDRFTYVGMLGFCAELDDFRMGIVLHCQTIKLKLDTTAFIGNVLMTMYAKFNYTEEMEKAFRLIEEKDVISWNTLISAHTHCDDHEKGLRFFKEMTDESGIRPDEFTFTSVLSACAGHASIRYGKQIHAYLIRRRLYNDTGVNNALVSMYAKCGSIEYGHKVFNKMVCRNILSWNTMIAGFGNHGLAGKAIEVFEQMQAMNIKPDSVTFIGLLIACNHAGFVEMGQFYLNSMQEIYGVAPNKEHVSCLVDMLGRAGKLSEAEEYLKQFQFGNDPIVLGSLLSACRLHGSIDIGKRFAKQLLELQPFTTSPYVLLSNLCASDKMWGDVANARKMLMGSGFKKEPGHSMVEVEGRFEKFMVGDFSHFRMVEIKDILTILNAAVGKIFSADIT